MVKRKSTTTHDVAKMLKNISDLLLILPETKLSEIDHLADLITLASNESVAEKSNSTYKPKRERIDTNFNWLDDNELKEMDKQILHEYLQSERFPSKQSLYDFSCERNISGINKRSSRDNIIDTIMRHYEKMRMFKTMSDVNKRLD